jgi:Holliday junction DNA helicase RuvB
MGSSRTVLKPQAAKPDKSEEQSVRPGRLNEYIGQASAKEAITVVLESAKARQEAADHIILYGPPGLGKTTLAQIVSHELDVPFKGTSGPALERTGDLVSLLSALTPQTVLFIDEIHRLRRPLEEILYPAMEDRRVDVMMGKGPGARAISLNLPPFTLIGATTRLGSLSNPLRDRFGTILHLDFYSEAELAVILQQAARKLNLEVDEDAVQLIASRSRRTPRLALRLLRRSRDWALARENQQRVHSSAVTATLNLLGIDSRGLDELDRRYIQTLTDSGHPVGVSTLAATLHEDRETIEGVIEPYLLREGLIQRTPQGRCLTTKGNQPLKLLE